jgi:hypothetical protein
MEVTEFEEKERDTELFVNPQRSCLECSSKQYVFRGVRRVTALLIPVQHGRR